MSRNARTAEGWPVLAYWRNRAAPKRYELDGEPIDVFDFMQANDLCTNEVRAVLELGAGEVYQWGGGAAPRFTLERTR